MVDRSTVLSVLSNVFLFLLIGGMAGTTDIKGFRAKLRNYRGTGTGVACQFFLLPFLGFAAVRAFGLDQVYGVMLLIVTTSPGGGFSGWWCSLSNADLALSVAMTTVSTIVSIAMLPLNIYIYVQAIYGIEVPLDWAGIMTSVGVVIGAVIIGLALGTYKPEYKTWWNRVGTVGGLANIAVGLFTSSGAETPIWGQAPTWYIAIAAPCIAGLIIAFGIAKALRCTGPEAVAICIECCYQNTALAITVAVSVFDERDAALATLVPIFYGGIEIGVIALFALIAWQANWTYASRSDGLVKCITGNYQPEEPDDGAEWNGHPHVQGQQELVSSAGSGSMDVDKALDPSTPMEPVNEAERQRLVASLRLRQQDLQGESARWEREYRQRTGRVPTTEARRTDVNAAEIMRRMDEVAAAIRRYQSVPSAEPGTIARV